MLPRPHSPSSASTTTMTTVSVPRARASMRNAQPPRARPGWDDSNMWWWWWMGALSWARDWAGRAFAFSFASGTRVAMHPWAWQIGVQCGSAAGITFTSEDGRMLGRPLKPCHAARLHATPTTPCITSQVGKPPAISQSLLA